MTTISNAIIAETFTRFLTFKLEEAEQAKQSLVESVTKDPLYALSWAQDGAVALAVGTLYREVQLRTVEAVAANPETAFEGHVLFALETVRDIAVRRLLSNELRGGSSSAFSNATESATREALSRFVRDNEHTLERAVERDELPS